MDLGSRVSGAGVTKWRNRVLSATLLSAAVTMGAVAIPYQIHSFGYLAVAYVLLIGGIITADLRGPDDPDLGL